MTRYFFSTSTAMFLQLDGTHLSERPFSPDWVEITKAAFDTLLLDHQLAAIDRDDLTESLEECLVIVDKWRTDHLGDGDIAAMNARIALRAAKGEEEPDEE